jgi:hypothetical protein
MGKYSRSADVGSIPILQEANVITVKINNKTINRMLTAKLQPHELLISQSPPKFLYTLVGSLASKLVLIFS